MSADRLTDSEMRADSEGSYLAAIEQMRTTGHGVQSSGHLRCDRVSVADVSDIYLELGIGEKHNLAGIVLGPADAVALASDLLNAARRRYGRAQPEET